MEWSRAARVLGVVRRHDDVARLDRRERDTGERLADRVAQAEIRIGANRADDVAVARLRQSEHRAMRA